MVDEEPKKVINPNPAAPDNQIQSTVVFGPVMPPEYFKIHEQRRQEKLKNDISQIDSFIRFINEHTTQVDIEYIYAHHLKDLEELDHSYPMLSESEIDKLLKSIRDQYAKDANEANNETTNIIGSNMFALYFNNKKYLLDKTLGNDKAFIKAMDQSIEALTK